MHDEHDVDERAGVVGLLEACDVAARVEREAVEVARMKELRDHGGRIELGVVRVLKVEEDVLEIGAQAELLLVGERVATGGVQVALDEHELAPVVDRLGCIGICIALAQIGGREEREGEVARERIEIAQGERGHHRLALGHVPNGGGHLGGEVLANGVRDEEGTRATTHHEHAEPREAHERVTRAHRVRHGVHFEQLHLGRDSTHFILLNWKPKLFFSLLNLN